MKKTGAIPQSVYGLGVSFWRLGNRVVRFLGWFLGIGLLLVTPALVGAQTAAPAKPPAKATPSAESVLVRSRSAVELRVRAQKERDAFATQEAKLLDRVEALEQRARVVMRRRRKLEAYLADQRGKIARLEQRLAAMQRLREDLEPLLDDSCSRLEQMLKERPAFLPGSGRAKVAALRRALDDYDLGLGAKAKRLFEVLKAQATQGRRVAVSEDEVQVGGKLRRVQLVRLGDLALFALDGTGRHAWRYDIASGGFTPLDGWWRELSHLVEIAQRRRVVSLVEVPLGRRLKPAGEGEGAQ